MSVYSGAAVFASIFWIIFALMASLSSYVLVAAELVGNWFTFKKMHMPGWKGIIPFYNLYVLFEKLWEVKEFRRVMIYLGVYLGAFIIGDILAVVGGIMAAGIGYGAAYAASVIMTVLGILMILGSLVFVVLAIVKEYQLYKRMAFAFGLKSAWAWGLLFLPYVFLPIIGFNKKIIYYGPMRQM